MIKIRAKRVDIPKPPYIIYCNQALEVYKALGIKKEQIEKRQAWQNYIETHLYVTWNYPPC